ncbi:hypothetical protein MM239_11880 [Belliella sp. DSM 111904]|uniref:Lipoprotein n=1 Tax=Belliella filtrata TaxID=2923435 RepID=A0ABS9V0Z8_9BACT|nr:hypothetical protein [Belliella filtrata]MCH7410097.1 hypothetical protein [Belliella filtrata]
MKVRLFYLIIASALIGSCTSSPEQMMSEVLQGAISYHDPANSWLDIETIKVNTSTVQYDADGNELMKLENEYEFRMKPFFEGKTKWVKDSVTHRVTFDGLTTSYKMGNNEVLNEGFLQNKRQELQIAFVDIAFPMNHLQVAKSLSYLNKAKISGNREAEILELLTKDDKKISLYFLPESHEVIGYKRKFRDSYEVVNTVENDYFDGLLLPRKKEVFASDSLGNHLYLKAIVTYNYLN